MQNSTVAESQGAPDDTTTEDAKPSSPARPRKAHHGGGIARGLLSVVLVLVILAGGLAMTYLIASMREAPRRAEPVERIQTVQTFAAETATVQELVTAFGTARAMQEVVLSAQVAGEIVETMMPLKIGQPVAAATFETGTDGVSRPSGGDLIARIDPKTYQERVEQSEDLLNENEAELARLQQEQTNLQTRLAIARKNFEAYQKEYARIESLVQQGIASSSDLTAAELDLRTYEDAKVQIETELALMPQKILQIEARQRTQRNDLDLSKLDLERTAVKSPINGQLSEINVERGQYVRVGDPLVTVTSTQQVEIPIGVAMADYLKMVPRIRKGDYPRAIISSRSTQDAQWIGVVTRASPVADVETRTVDVFIVVDNEQYDSPLLPGTFVTVQIEGPVYRDVVPIPRDAILDDSVLVVRDGKVAQALIDKVADIQSIRLVSFGLQSGDQVVMTNLDILEPGMAVRTTDQNVQTLESELQRTRVPNLRILPRSANNP